MCTVLRICKCSPPEITGVSPTRSSLLNVELECALGEQVNNSTTKALLVACFMGCKNWTQSFVPELFSGPLMTEVTGEALANVEEPLGKKKQVV